MLLGGSMDLTAYIFGVRSRYHLARENDHGSESVI